MTWTPLYLLLVPGPGDFPHSAFSLAPMLTYEASSSHNSGANEVVELEGEPQVSVLKLMLFFYDRRKL